MHDCCGGWRNQRTPPSNRYVRRFANKFTAGPAAASRCKYHLCLPRLRANFRRPVPSLQYLRYSFATRYGFLRLPRYYWPATRLPASTRRPPSTAIILMSAFLSCIYGGRGFIDRPALSVAASDPSFASSFYDINHDATQRFICRRRPLLILLLATLQPCFNSISFRRNESRVHLLSGLRRLPAAQANGGGFMPRSRARRGRRRGITAGRQST